MSPWTVAAVQMAVEAGRPGRNLERALALVEGLRPRPDLVVLPELFTTGYDLERARELAPAGPACLERLGRWCRDAGVRVAGSVLHPWGGGVANAGFFVEADGRCLDLYPKVHRFRPMDEHRYLRPGRTPRVWRTGLGPVAVAICYDLRFPVFCHRLALSGAVVLLVPAEWPRPRTDHWELLLRARAVENAWYVVGANRVGPGEGAVFEGASQVVSPWGEVLAHAGRAEGAAVARVDPARLHEARGRIPVYDDRVPGLDDPARLSGEPDPGSAGGGEPVPTPGARRAGAGPATGSGRG